MKNMINGIHLYSFTVITFYYEKTFYQFLYNALRRKQ